MNPNRINVQSQFQTLDHAIKFSIRRRNQVLVQEYLKVQVKR